jgi:hypothetical protein
MSARVPLGRLVVTRGVNDSIADSAAFAKDVCEALGRFVAGDWGNVDPEDRAENDRALLAGNRLLGSYRAGQAQEKIWVITEADRSVTTVLFPDEY